MNYPFTKYIMNSQRICKKSMCNFNNTITQFNIYSSVMHYNLHYDLYRAVNPKSTGRVIGRCDLGGPKF